jgi:glutamyl-tRNA synthetase
MVRVRFAPSPTGQLHVGGARSALFNWLFARHHGGKFLLRIEDTDLERSRQEYADGIIETFNWLSMESDEPVVIQSSRFGEHKKVLDLLLAQNKVYFCYCTEAELEQMKAQQVAQGQMPKYDGRCRTLTPDVTRPHAVRFKLPFISGPITFNDLVHGPITIDAQQLDDFVIVRSDGVPMYNFVVVLDDAFMRISHVIRGEEHIPNTPKQILLYQACGYPIPEFAHISMILGSGGEKLSKRHGAVAVADYRAMGYLPEAFINYLVRLGWSYGDQELFTRQELIQFFSLAHVHTSGAVFDQAKLDWVNGMYLRDAQDSFLLQQIEQSVEPALMQKLHEFTRHQIISLIGLYKSRIKNLRQLVDELMLLHNPVQPTDSDIATFKTEQTVAIITRLLSDLMAVKDPSLANIQTLGKQLCDELHVKMPALAQPVRLALTSKTQSPGVYELVAILGIQESVSRLKKFHALLQV